MKNKSAILQMLYGQRGDSDKIKMNTQCEEYLSVADECMDSIKEKLKSMPEVWELFLKYREYMDLIHIEEVDAHYLEGFKFGLLIGVEAGESKFVD